MTLQQRGQLTNPYEPVDDINSSIYRASLGLGKPGHRAVAEAARSLFLLNQQQFEQLGWKQQLSNQKQPPSRQQQQKQQQQPQQNPVERKVKINRLHEEVASKVQDLRDGQGKHFYNQWVSISSDLANLETISGSTTQENCLTAKHFNIP